MATVLEFITAAMRLANYIGAGQTPSNEEAQDVMAHLNRLLASWNTERLNTFGTDYNVFDLQIGVQSYTLGSGGTFNMSRPLSLKAIVLIENGVEYDIVEISPKQWSAEQDKTLTGKLPSKLYNNYGFPLSTVKILPIPSTAAQIGFYTWTRFAAYLALTDVVSYPDGYEMALLYNLAVAIAAEFGVQIDPSIVALASQTKAALRDLNMPPVPGAAEEAAAAARAIMASNPQGGQAA